MSILKVKADMITIDVIKRLARVMIVFTKKEAFITYDDNYIYSSAPLEVLRKRGIASCEYANPKFFELMVKYCSEYTIKNTNVVSAYKLRRTEIQGLLWSDVGPDHLRIRPAKAAVERLVPIHEDLRPYLAERGEGPVVPGAYLAAGFYKRLRRIYEEAGVEYREGRPLNILRSSFHEAMMGAKEDS